MKKILALALVSAVIGDAYAVCPATLNGLWSGSVVKTRNTVVTNQDGSRDQLPPVTANGTYTANISGGTFTTTYYVESEAGVFGGINEDTSTSTSTMSYNKATCRGTVQTNETIIYFTVSNSGKTLKGVSNLKETGKFGDLELNSGETASYILERQ